MRINAMYIGADDSRGYKRNSRYELVVTDVKRLLGGRDVTLTPTTLEAPGVPVAWQYSSTTELFRDWTEIRVLDGRR